MASISDLLSAAVGSRAPDTQSLCPVCLKRVDAWRWQEKGSVWLLKQCDRHGDFKVPLWRGHPSWDSWQRPKKVSFPDAARRPAEKGCPFDCGLCEHHRQRSCTVLIDVTQRCNLVCPICFAASTHHRSADPTLEELAHRFENVSRLSPGSNIQLSGGEPTLRDDLPEIVALGKTAGFGFIQINTNGIRPARDVSYLHELASAGLDSLFLQFDGTHEGIYQTIRGKALLETKLKAIDACTDAGLGVVLVPTVVPGVNDGNLGAIIDLGLEHAPTVRGVHFQPISYFGRYAPAQPTEEDRITLPELMRAIEIQTGGAFPARHFSPSGCENAMCSFSAKFLIQPDQSVRPLLPAWSGCCGEAEPAEEGAKRSIAQTALQWSSIPSAPLGPGTAVQHNTSQTTSREGLMDLDQFIQQVRTRTFSISAMAFQDAWTLDLERVRECCIHVAGTRGRLIPFCLYHLTDIAGNPLYKS